MACSSLVKSLCNLKNEIGSPHPTQFTLFKVMPL